MTSRASILLTLLLLSVRVAATPDIQHWDTGNGVRVYFVELKELPIVDIQVLFDAGSARDPGDKNGLALLTNSLLDEGAGGLDANTISYDFEKLGARFGSDTGYDSAGVSLRCLSDEKLLKPALANLQRVITSPDFPGEALERQRNRLLINIRQKDQSPGATAADAFLAAIYPHHPYAEPKEGTMETVKNISRGDILEFFKKYYTAQNAAIAIVGDVSAEELAETLTAQLPRGEKQAQIPPVADLAAGTVIRKNFPSTQTHVIVGQPGIKRGDPDFYALYVGNQILGGNGLVSRLSQEIREKRGLTYSAYSYFSLRRERGPFVAGFQTRARQAPEALKVLRDTISKYIANGPSREELEEAKKNITGGFPLQIDSNSQILGYVAIIGYYGLPLNYLDTFVDRIKAVTVDDIKRAFQRHLNVNKFVTVLVGPAGPAVSQGEGD